MSDTPKNTKERIDNNLFEQMRELLEEDFNSLILEYIEDTKTRVAQLHDAFADEDNEAGYEIAHAIKGASANLGLMKLNELSYQMQEACRNEQIVKTAELIGEISKEVIATNAEIMRRLN